ncbi:hypothetical protein Prudu_006411 [Prunus dulcis]|uniref:Ankyrin repeat family protein n=1 Tax=Prunus dulcis TaxID=3755 RepID=A0A4Y1QZM6_PRUDU|nr:hypothetical protein Prudu_006411 [Prunus dulcis]
MRSFRIRPIVDRSPGYSEIPNPRSMTTAPSSDPPAQAASAATAPALLDHVVVAREAPRRLRHLRHPWRSHLVLAAAPAHRHHGHDIDRRYWCLGITASEEEHSRTVSSAEDGEGHRVTNSRISIGYDERHRAAPTAELHSSLAHDIGHVVRTHCPMQWKSWRVMPDEIKAEVRGQLSTNYNLEDLDEESLTYVNRLFAERHMMIRKSLFRRVARRSLRAEDSWEWLCAHFQAPEFANKAQVNKGNRKKKTLLHHSGSRPFSYRWMHEGSKFPEIDVFGDTTMVERSQLVLQESASQLPPETPIESVAPPQDAGFQILTETLDQTLGRRPGTYCRGMGNARRREPRPRSSRAVSSQVTALTAGGHSSEPDVGHSAVPRTVRHSSPAF